MLRALLQLAGWTAVAVLSVVVIFALIAGLGGQAEHPPKAVNWIAVGVALLSAGVSFLIYRSLALAETNSDLPGEPVPRDPSRPGLVDVATQVSNRYFRGGLGAFPFIIGAVLIYFALVIPLLLAMAYTNQALGIHFDDEGSVWLTILAGTELFLVWIGPMVVVILAYRWSVRWLRRKAPSWLRFFGLN